MKIFLLILMISCCYGATAQIGVSTIGVSVIGKDSVALNSDTLGKADIVLCVSPALCARPTLKDFTGKRISPATVLLNWTIAAEQNNKGFWLERSFDQPGPFTSTAYIPGRMSNSSLAVYNYTDTNSFTGITYYRLRQLDLDGSITYSKIIAVAGTPAILQLLLFPNPNTGSFVMKLPASLSGGIARVSIQHANGAVVFRHTYTVSSGLLFINLPDNLRSGQYFIRVLLDNEVLQSSMLLIRR